ncbi:P-loop containing nucleoside triphosphate hydrolase protein [Martensiomyces pterosporus]|nr:P-loop containing nucleoside triphosphate hydrolase protein [Martensiomyces pterosporus]
MSRVIVVGLAGPSCSGKTTVALNLIKLFPHTVVIHQDDFYRPDSQIPVNSAVGVQDWDCPGSFDMCKLVEDILATRDKLERLDSVGSVSDLRDHFASQWANPPEDVDQLIPAGALNAICASMLDDLGIGSADQMPFYVVLVDGILLFHDRDGKDEQHPGDACDAGLFIYAQHATLKERREARVAYSTKEGIWTDPPGYFDSIVWPNFVKYHAEFIKSHPQVIGSADKGQVPAGEEPGPWGSKVAICSSDIPAEDMLKACVKSIISEWNGRR